MTGRVGGGRSGAEPLDLRLLPVAVALWAGTFAGVELLPVPVLVAGSAAVTACFLVCVAWWRRRPGEGFARGHRAVAMLAVLGLAVGLLAGVTRSMHVRGAPVLELADEEAYVHLEGVVATDPQLHGDSTGRGVGRAAEATGGEVSVPDLDDDSVAGTDTGRAPGADGRSGSGAGGPGAAYVLARIRVDELVGRGVTYQLRVPLLVVTNDLSWMDLLPGQRLRVRGQLSPADGDVAAFLRVRVEPELLGGPGLVARMTEPLRAGLRDAVAAVPGAHRALVPGMVIGDETMMSEQLREDMRVTGLTHLTAVSGTHVGIVLLAVLGAARLVGIRGYALPVVAVLSLAGFVLLVRPDPSVLRAAVMGTVAVLGLLVAGRRRAVPALATAVSVLVLVDPWLARSVGFALSVSATAGIILLVPAWERSMAWLPRPLALALAVPVAAQVACTPVLLATFGQLSVASVPANMLVAPVVAPAMVLGLVAAVLSPALPVLAATAGWLAGLPAWWIATVARWLAAQPGAELEWPDGAVGGAAGVAVAAAAMAALPLVLRRPLTSVLMATLLVVVLLRAVPAPGWPPTGWVVVACDVGQGDATVLRAGPQSAVVVDAGPDPEPMRRCLDSLGINDVPLLVLTHYHADHVDGVPGVLAGRDVGHALVSPLDDPPSNAARVARWLADAGVAVDVARAGERRAVGASLSFEVLWPRRVITTSAESDSNNASVVLAADVAGVDVLLTGDIEPMAQRALLRSRPRLSTKILKVSHHGSHRQDERMLTGLGANVALIGVGENSHGHPSDAVLSRLSSAGTQVYRTDEDGTIAVVGDGDALAVATR